MFITFEGGEGSGKTTQARLLAEWLGRQRFNVVLVREPGSTPLGQQLRRLVKGTAMSPNAELLLFGAARAELVTTVVRPYLKKGCIVISDRYADSTVAYQQYGRDLPSDAVAKAIEVATSGLKPDLTFLLDLPPERRSKRAGQSQLALPMEGASPARIDDASQSRFERESLQFHRKVRAGYKALVEREPKRWVAIDATGTIEAIRDEIAAATLKRLPPTPKQFVSLVDLTE